ncbi:MAG: hypothetical protein AAFY26_02085 [Cyanobacteria bacterium J06638_22]
MLYQFIYPVRCRLVEGKTVAEPGDSAVLTPEQARILSEFVVPIAEEGKATPEVEQPKTPDEAIAPPEPPVTSEAVPVTPALPDNYKTNLNIADAVTLRTLKHIGKVTASKLIAARPLQSLEDAQVASELSDDQWAEIVDALEV